METPDSEIKLRLLFVLHRAWVEARLLAQEKACDQLYDLAEAVEPIPASLSRWDEQDIEILKFNLSVYESKYPSSNFRYIEYLDLTKPSPPTF